MIFSRIGRSLYRSARSSFQRNVISGNYAERAVLANESLLPSTGNACFSRADGGVGLVRGYVTSVGAGKQLVSNSHLSNFSSVLANPRVRRFFSSQAPKKKNYENYYPKDKKEIPKANEQKSESKGDSNTGDHGNSQENLVKQFQNLIAPLLCLAFIFSPIFVGPHDQKQVTVFPYSFSSRFIGF